MTNLTVISNENFLVSGDTVKTTSLKVAEAFGKRHTHVTEKIRGLECSSDFRSANFSAHPHTNEQNGEKYTLFEMTKDGFMFLVMGFTGKKAAGIKEAYINAFNRMAAQDILAAPSPLPFQYPFPDQQIIDFALSTEEFIRHQQAEIDWINVRLKYRRDYPGTKLPRARITQAPRLDYQSGPKFPLEQPGPVGDFLREQQNRIDWNNKKMQFQNELIDEQRKPAQKSSDLSPALKQKCGELLEITALFTLKNPDQG